MVELFAVGTFWFWALFAAEIVLLLVLENFNQGIAAAISVAGFVAFLQLFAKVNIVQYVYLHWYMVLPIMLGYIVLSSMWAVFKWRRHVITMRDKVEDMFTEFKIKHHVSPETRELPDNLKGTWKSEIESTRNYKTGETWADVPKIKHHKAELFRWTMLSVFSILLYLFKDVVSDIFNYYYKSIAKFLQNMANSLWTVSDLSVNLEVKPPEDRTTSRPSRRNDGT